MLLSDALDVLLRWFHVIAGIMWIGNSMLFNWLDRNLEKKPGIDGEIWLLHSGAFYQIEKKLLEPDQMPKRLHWFMYQNLSTWVSGILLLVVVYYVGHSAWLVDPGAGHKTFGEAALTAACVLIGGWAIYDAVWRSKLKERPLVAGVICIALFMLIVWVLSKAMTPRAATMHAGVLLGTLMTGNVWMVIIPSQRDLVAATKGGRPQDRALSLKAKQRSIHNNYMTFPLIYTMIANHFPALYSHRLSWLLLFVISIGGALVRHFMNIRFTFTGWRWALAGSATATVALSALLLSRPAAALEDDELAKGPPVAFDEVHAILSLRCVACHSKTPSDSLFKVAPNGLILETPAQIAAAASRIRVRVEGLTMPFQNKTGMTPAERLLVARWVAQGASLRAVALPGVPATSGQTPPGK